MPAKNPERIRAIRRRYYLRHKAAIRAKNLARYHANRKRCLKRQKAWRRRNLGRVNAYDRRYRMEKKIRELTSLPKTEAPSPKAIEVARKLLAKADQVVKKGYTGKLTPGGI